MTNPSELKLTWNPAFDPWRKISATKTWAYAGKQGARNLTALDTFLIQLANNAHAYGLSFDVMVAMSLLETDTWRARHWVDHLNPGSIGITDIQDFGYDWDDGVEAAHAMTVHFSVYAVGFDWRMMRDKIIQHDPRYLAVFEAGFAGTCKTLADLGNGKWASDPKYAQKVAARYDLLRAL
jgi:hypothetical protein